MDSLLAFGAQIKCAGSSNLIHLHLSMVVPGYNSNMKSPWHFCITMSLILALEGKSVCNWAF